MRRRWISATNEAEELLRDSEYVNSFRVAPRSTSSGRSRRVSTIQLDNEEDEVTALVAEAREDMTVRGLRRVTQSQDSRSYIESLARINGASFSLRSSVPNYLPFRLPFGTAVRAYTHPDFSGGDICISCKEKAIDFMMMRRADEAVRLLCGHALCGVCVSTQREIATLIGETHLRCTCTHYSECIQSLTDFPERLLSSQDYNERHQHVLHQNSSSPPPSSSPDVQPLSFPSDARLSVANAIPPVRHPARSIIADGNKNNSRYFFLYFFLFITLRQ